MNLATYSVSALLPATVLFRFATASAALSVRSPEIFVSPLYQPSSLYPGAGVAVDPVIAVVARICSVWLVGATVPFPADV